VRSSDGQARNRRNDVEETVRHGGVQLHRRHDFHYPFHFNIE
jgi:hypothetical protein